MARHLERWMKSSDSALFFCHDINQTGLKSPGTVPCLLEESIKHRDSHLKSGKKYKLKWPCLILFCKASTDWFRHLLFRQELHELRDVLCDEPLQGTNPSEPQPILSSMKSCHSVFLLYFLVLLVNLILCHANYNQKLCGCYLYLRKAWENKSDTRNA